jgi:hypothetical protein
MLDKLLKGIVNTTPERVREVIKYLILRVGI